MAPSVKYYTLIYRHEPWVYCKGVSRQSIQLRSSTHLGVLESLVSACEGRFDGQWCRIDLAYTTGGASFRTRMRLSAGSLVTPMNEDKAYHTRRDAAHRGPRRVDDPG